MSRTDERGANGVVLQYDYDYIFGLPGESCAVCLSDREIAWILTNLDYGHWKTRWYGSYDKATADALIDGLSEKLMNSFCSDIQNGMYQNQLTLIAVLNNQRIAQFVPENPQSIDSNCPPAGGNFEAGGGGGATGDDGLCVACEAYVRHKLDETLKSYLAEMGAAAAATGVLAALTGGLGGILGGAAVVIAAIAYSNVRAAASDDNAIHAVACRLADALKTHVATQSNFTSAIDGLTSSTATEATIVSVLKAGAGSSSWLGGQQRLSNYLHFLQLLGGAVVSVQSGAAACTCGQWCYTFDFVASDGGWTVVSGAGGSWSGSWQSTTVIGAGSAYYNQIYIEIPIASSEITYVKFSGSKVRGDSAADADGLQLNSTFVATWDANFSGSYVREWSGDVSGVTVLRLYVVAGENTYPPGGSASIVSCKVKGIGTNPFGSDNCLP